MIKDYRRQHLTSVVAMALAMMLIGAILGYPLIALLLYLIGYVAWSMWQQNKLIEWLKRKDTTAESLPDTDGPMGMVFDYLYGLLRRHRLEVHRLNAVINRFQTSTSALEDGIVIVNQDGTLEWWNEAAGDLLSFQPQDRGQLINNLIRSPKFQKFFRNAVPRTKVNIPAPRREHLTLQIAITIYGENERLLWVRDISRLRQLEQMRKDFVSNASHELRTPLTVLQGYLETFIDMGDVLPERMHRPLQQMQAQTRRMTNLVNDLMLLTRLDGDDDRRGDMQVYVRQLLESIVEDAQALSGDKHHQIELNIETEADLMGDPNSLRSAFSNLVFNAVHYTPENGQIIVSWRQDERFAYMSVEDSGIGIEARHIPRLTERFYRVNVSHSTATGGTGLGLAIVKHALQIHDGTLDISSEVGKGSTFTCRFPVKNLYQQQEEQLAEE
ncbi:phosphate regulon sensor histidine kinase PhoR [Gynuella sunshinyii]|uniref:Phosphate regulon sensor protein PhoR n=1 Tax=Gynuella sunshinyii YC6258 TaxID=1445510 RepID=A0A0C5VRR3_9GAMM|nr:phosphate regulon sensor histidine kinase PhoR [Gynuella sunshinyii]AJQ92959.1 signal transduction histidine kinase [Gynuella sunshinyii YC6258]